MNETYHLVKYDWEGDLFSKEGVSKGAVFDPSDDPVISCSLSGRRAYLHPASGLAFVRKDLGKTVENVVEGVTWAGPQYIQDGSVGRFLDAVKERDGFSLMEKDVRIEEERANPTSISEVAKGNREYPELKKAYIYRDTQSRSEPQSWYDVIDSDRLEFYGGKVHAGCSIHCASLIQMIAESMQD